VLLAIDLWNLLTTVLTRFEPLIVFFVAMCGMGGVTLIIAMVADVLDVLTTHIYCLYVRRAPALSRSRR
jgi:hypothetical protein